MLGVILAREALLGHTSHYLPKKMLLALIEELGHEYVGLDELLINVEIQIFYLTRQ